MMQERKHTVKKPLDLRDPEHPVNDSRDVVTGFLPTVFPYGTDFEKNRRFMLEKTVDLCFGRTPPEPEVMKVRRVSGSSYRIEAGSRERTVTWELQLTRPFGGDARRPVLLTGDRAAGYCNEAVKRMFLSAGFLIAEFDRNMLAEDSSEPDMRTRGLYPVYPDYDFGMLSAWAWGYRRSVDALLTMGDVDPDCICITGHSRGGKATLLAGALDERIAFTQASGSGMFGCGCLRYTQVEAPEREIQDHHSEVLGNMFGREVGYSIAHWVGAGMEAYIGREDEIPFDFHFLKAAIAPRGLLETGSVDDVWANPRGSYQTFRAAREAYAALGVPGRIASSYRYGPHFHAPEDFRRFLDFITACREGKPFLDDNADRVFGTLPKIYDWSVPEGEETEAKAAPFGSH